MQELAASAMRGHESLDPQRLTHPFEALVHEYQDRIFNLAFNFLGEREAARDVAQETFLRAFRGLREFRADSSYYTWISTIAVNLCRSQLRRARVRGSVKLFSLLRPPDKESGSLAPIVSSHERPQDALHREERDKEIRNAVADLDQQLKQVVVLRDMEGFSYQDVANMLGIPLGTVRSRLHRAREILREKLASLVKE